MIVEYVLLLVVAIAIAFAIRMALVKTGETSADSGAVIKQWDSMEQAIGSDDPNHR